MRLVGDFAPEWLDRSLMAMAWKNGCPEIDVDAVDISCISKVGGGALSETYRVATINRPADGFHHEKNSQKSFFIKSSPNRGGIVQEFIDSGVFYKEKMVYSRTLPSIERTLKQVEGSSSRPIGPRLYYEGDHPVDFLVLEDLVASGFSGFRGRQPLDWEHTLVAVRRIARMHAASITILDDQEYSKEPFRHNLIFNHKYRDLMDQHVEKVVSSIVDILDEFPWFRQYRRKIEVCWKKLLGKAVASVYEDSPFKVLLHGDLHSGNMMFRTSEEELEVRFYDYQGAHVGCPAEDLQYLLHTSVQLEVLRDHSESLLTEYHSTLTCTLRALGLQSAEELYPLQQLRRDMERLHLLGLYCTYSILPYQLVADVAELDFDSSAPDYNQKVDRLNSTAYRNPVAHQYLHYLTSLYDSKGLLDL